MKRLIVCLALLVAACSGNSPTSPTATGALPGSVETPAPPSAAPGGPAADLPPGRAADAPVPQFTVSGPTAPGNCYTYSSSSDLMRWLLNVSDAGPRHLRFVALAHHEGVPGCEATAKNPRTRIEVSGKTDYTPHSSGQTTFTFNPKMYDCGRVQVDVSIFDSAGNEILIIVAVVNYGSVCAPPPPNALVCAPPNGTTVPGVPYTFTATGGSGSYSWSTAPAVGGTPSTGSGATFTQTFSVEGTYIATVTSAGQSATCAVTVQQLVTPEVVCQPPTQTVPLNQLASVVAVQGNGVYAWSAPGGSPASGSGASFATTYATPGTHTISVTSAGVTSTCTVNVPEPPPPPPPLVCAPPTQTVNINEAATVSATGGTGTYAWSAPGGSMSSGSGSSFSTSYPAAGTNTITVTSGSESATCQVVVPPPPPIPPVCAPPTQTVGVNQSASLSATQGNGTYSWSAPGGLVASGSGASFATSYAAPGTYSVTVTSGGLSATCEVVVSPPPNPPVVCAPPNQTVALGAPVNLSATGGSGGYTWAAPGSTTPSATGSSFTTSYQTEGNYAVTVSSSGDTTTCYVTVQPPPPPTPLVCTPPNQTVAIGVAANMSATGGTGTYSWSAPGGSNATGAGATFSTAYATAGSYTVTVSSGAQTATCNVSVPQPPPVNSCAGTNAAILDLVPPTGTVRFSVPQGQVANLSVVVGDRTNGQELTYSFPNVPAGLTDVEVPVSCFSKVAVFCGSTELANVRGPNLCAVP